SDLNFGTIRGDGVAIQATGSDIFIDDGGQIDGRDGDVEIKAGGNVTQAAGVNPAVSGDAITVVANGNVGLPNIPLTVDGSGAVFISFADGNGAAFISGVFGSLNEGPNVLGLGSNTVLANNVGAIQSSFEERVSFKLDSSQFATETRIFSVEGTGILPPKDQRE
ncbi:MAG: hypothetical protein K0S14_2024, partial [Thermomicrobiales bacterium]|nr:hypothetical protein [Thermomicrobiales bacterium]